jgi:hypothetical protein
MTGRARRAGPSVPIPQGAQAAAPHVSERARGPNPTTEEQVAVLKMVQEGKITPDEADMLLKALGV